MICGLLKVGAFSEELLGIFYPQGPRPEVLVEAQLAAAEAEQQEKMRRELRGSTIEERAAELTALRRHQEEQRTREIHVVKKDVSRLGGTACCGACERLMIGVP